MATTNPEAPPTSKQLETLQKITGRDWLGKDITTSEAQYWIAKLSTPQGIMRYEIQNAKTLNIVSERQPFNEPQVTLITGAQRSGKNNTATGRVVERSDNAAVAKFLKDTYGMINVDVKGYDRLSRIAKLKLKEGIVFIKIPESYKLNSPLRVFCNYHLFGIPYVYCPSFRFILAGLKCGFISDGDLIMDEYYMGGYNRASLESLPKALAQQSNQYAKGMLRVTMLAPIANQLDWTARLAPTETITTEYNKVTREITCHIKKKDVPGEKVITYDATRYWRNYKTNERINN